MNEERKQQIEDILECSISLNTSLQRAGGKGLDLNDLKKLSGLDLICYIGPNKIRFCYEGEVIENKLSDIPF